MAASQQSLPSPTNSTFTGSNSADPQSGMMNGNTQGGGGYNSYNPPQQYNNSPSHQHQQPHQPYFARNPSNNFRGGQNHHHNQHHQPQFPDQGHPQNNHYSQAPHPSHLQPQQPYAPQQHNPQFQHRYPDQGVPPAYNGWTGGGGPYHPSPNQPYPQMGGPGPATMQNQNGYAYGMEQFGRQQYGGMYGAPPQGYAGPEGDFQSNPTDADPSQSLSYPNGPPPSGDYPYPPPLPTPTGQSPHPHPASIPSLPNGTGPYPPYFPPNHPYNFGGGIGAGIGYPQYPPGQGYGGYGFGDGFMPPPIPNGVTIPPMNSSNGIPQTNGPSRSLNPAAQGFKFVPSNQPPPPASAPPPPIAAPPPPPAETATAPVFASIRRSSTPETTVPAQPSQAKFSQPVLVDGEKLKGIGGKRRDSETEYVEPASSQGLAGGDTLGLSDQVPHTELVELLPPSPLNIATATKSIDEPKLPSVTQDKQESTPSQPESSSPDQIPTPKTDDAGGRLQFTGPVIPGFTSPPSAAQPSLAQTIDKLPTDIPKSQPQSTSSARAKPVMDGPIIYTSTRPLASENGDNAYKSTATLRAVGEGIKSKGKDKAQRRRAVFAVGEGLRAGTKGQKASGSGKGIQFGDVEAIKEEVSTPAGSSNPASEPKGSSDGKTVKVNAPTSASTTSSAPVTTDEISSTSQPISTPIPETSDAAVPAAAPTPTPAPAPPKPKQPPTSWAALVSSKPSTSAPSVASTTATPTPSAGPSKLPSPTRSTAPLPSTPEATFSETMPSAPKVAVTPSSAPAGPASKRPAFNYAAAAAAGAALSPADELVKLLSEGLGHRGMAPGVSKGTIPRGLINTGNMCFINTILQVLAYCPPFTDLLETLGQRLKADLGRKTPLLEAVIIFLRELQPSSSTPTPALNVSNGALPSRGMTRATTAPTSFQQGRGMGGKDAFVPENVYDAMKENKRFDSMRRGFQEDAEEYLGFFLNTLHEELLFLLSRTHTRSSPLPNGSTSSDNREHSIERPVSPSADSSSAAWLEVGKKQRTHVVRSNESRESAITRIFGGTLRSILHIPGSKDSITLEPYQPLQLDISESNSVADALRHLSTPETVQTWSNAKKENIDATKTVYVETWPGVLMCHLKRFVYDSEEREVVKRSRAVAYGTELIIPNEIISPTKRSSVPVKYRLFGVVYHHGSTASGGHYTVAVSRQDHQQWIHFDDETVQPVSTDQVIVSPEEAESGRAGLIGGREKCAYLLFYQRIRG